MQSIENLKTGFRSSELVKSVSTDFLKSKNTSRLYNSVLEDFLSTVQKTGAEVCIADIQSYVNEKLRNGQKISTVNTKIAVLKSIWKSYKLSGLIKFNPFELVKKMRERKIQSTIPLNDKQVDRLLSSIDNENDYAIVLFLVATGIRVSELCGLKWGDFTIDKDFVIAKILGKGNAERLVKIPEKVFNTIPVNQSEFVFDGVYPRKVDRIIKKWVKKSGVSTGFRVSAHTLRHTFITNAYKNGADLFYIQEAVGHNSPDMTRRYTKLSDIMTNNPVDKLSYLKNIGDSKREVKS